MTAFQLKELIVLFVNQATAFPRQQINNAYTSCTESFKNKLGTILGTFLSPNQLLSLHDKVENVNEFFAKQAV